MSEYNDALSSAIALLSSYNKTRDDSSWLQQIFSAETPKHNSLQQHPTAFSANNTVEPPTGISQSGSRYTNGYRKSARYFANDLLRERRQAAELPSSSEALLRRGIVKRRVSSGSSNASSRTTSTSDAGRYLSLADVSSPDYRPGDDRYRQRVDSRERIGQAHGQKQQVETRRHSSRVISKHSGLKDVTRISISQPELRQVPTDGSDTQTAQSFMGSKDTLTSHVMGEISSDQPSEIKSRHLQRLRGTRKLLDRREVHRKSATINLKAEELIKRIGDKSNDTAFKISNSPSCELVAKRDIHSTSKLKPIDNHKDNAIDRYPNAYIAESNDTRDNKRRETESGDDVKTTTRTTGLQRSYSATTSRKRGSRTRHYTYAVDTSTDKSSKESEARANTAASGSDGRWRGMERPRAAHGKRAPIQHTPVALTDIHTRTNFLPSDVREVPVHLPTRDRHSRRMPSSPLPESGRVIRTRRVAFDFEQKTPRLNGRRMFSNSLEPRSILKKTSASHSSESVT